MKFIRRSQRVAFMDTDTTGKTPKYERMKKFTSFENSKNPKQYNRQYVDEDTETGDVVGYAPSISYSFDRHTENSVHERIAAIHDGEMLGDDTHVSIVIVDLFTKTEGGTCDAIKRTYSVIPDADGSSTDALIYSGTLKSVSEIVKGTATVSDDGLTATFSEAASA